MLKENGEIRSYFKGSHVLILILMEHAQRGDEKRNDRLCKAVLILILMEHAQRVPLKTYCL